MRIEEWKKRVVGVGVAWILVDLLCCIFLGLRAGSFTEQKGVAKKVMSDSPGMVSFGIGR